MPFSLKNIIARPTGESRIDLFQRDVVELLKQIVINVFTAAVDGLVPAPVTVTGTKFLCDDGTWKVP